MKIDKKAFEKLIEEDIKYLNEISEENSLERKHIVECLDALVGYIYPAWIEDELKTTRKIFDEWLPSDYFNDGLIQSEIDDAINGFLGECVKKGLIKPNPIAPNSSRPMDKPNLEYERGN